MTQTFVSGVAGAESSQPRLRAYRGCEGSAPATRRFWISCIGFFLVLTGPAIADEGTDFFEAKVRPVLVENCYKCHAGKKVMAGLSLDARASILQGGDNGPAIVPGAPEKSLLLKAVGYGDPDLRMPPKGKLPEAVIADLAEWVRKGAPWPDDAANQKAAKVGDFNLKERARHWSLQPLTHPAVPKVKDAAWPASPVDFFILAKLEEKGLAPAPPADRRTLIRRVTFDLIGLPPTPAEIETFLKDDSPQAFATVVERLLSSPHYGERWARHWLDLVRFAETYGHEFDPNIPEAWRYRDYVIHALNADLPYDQFVREHLAGDLLPSPRRHPAEKYNESVLGTGFWWLGEEKHSPVDSRTDQADRIDNQIDVLGKAFLGLTLACARCHDHKFDAVSTKDYYALAGLLQSSRQDWAFIDDPAVRGPPLRRLREILDQIRALLPARAPAPCVPKGAPYTVYADFGKDAWAHWFRTGEAFGDRPTEPGDVMLRAGSEPIAVPPGLAHSGALSPALQGTLRSPTFTIAHKHIHYLVAGRQTKVNLILNGLQLIQEPIYGKLTFALNNDSLHWHTQDVAMWLGQRAYVEVLDDGPGYAAVAAVVFSDSFAPPALPTPPTAADPPPSPEVRKKVQALAAEFRQVEASLPPPRRALATADGSPVDESVFIRGNAKTLGPVVPRRFLEVFGGDRVPAPPGGSGRLELARQMTDPARTPILPRVMVNRLWKHHFVDGIVRSPDDFGVLGQPPTHPELLDFLAGEFVKGGWSLKNMHRMMVLSRAYQMASRADPQADAADADNKLLHRMPIRRLEAEAIRDAMLAVSGRLDPTLYGPSVMPHLTPFMVGRGRPTIGGPLDGAGRRSLYLNVRRNFLTPMFLAFDYPTPFSTMGRRSVSNVPAQALTMMNNPLVLQQAELWAKRTLAQAGQTPRQRVHHMYEEALGRPPTEAEASAALAFLHEQARLYSPDEARAWADLAHVLFNVKEFIFIN
jgi:hypothetical protein